VIILCQEYTPDSYRVRDPLKLRLSDPGFSSLRSNILQSSALKIVQTKNAQASLAGLPAVILRTITPANRKPGKA
jgi:hypothetical protein